MLFCCVYCSIIAFIIIALRHYLSIIARLKNLGILWAGAAQRTPGAMRTYVRSRVNSARNSIARRAQA